MSNFCVALTLKEYIYFCLILKFDFDLVLGFMIDAVFQSLIFFTQILLFLFWFCWGVWETPNIVNSLTGKLSMYHLPTYFLQYPSNISILMLLSLRCLRHSEWRERFDTTTPPRLINNHRPPSCVRCTEYFYCRTIDFFISSFQHGCYVSFLEISIATKVSDGTSMHSQADNNDPLPPSNAFSSFELSPS